MTIKITNKTLGIWYVFFKNDDLLFNLEKTDDGYKLTHRFRYYVDDKNFDSEDVKNWYEGIIKDDGRPVEDVIQSVRDVAELAATVRDGELTEILMGPDGDVDEFVERFMVQPWAHSSVEQEESTH